MAEAVGWDMKTKNVSRDTIEKIRITRISPNPDQAGTDFDEAGLAKLAASIKATGLLQPDFGRLTEDQISKIREAHIRYTKEYMRRYPPKADIW